MSSTLALAEARAEQATRDREAAATALEAAIAAAGIVRLRRLVRVPDENGNWRETLAPSRLPAEGFDGWRQIEAAVEADLYGPLGQTYSAFKRAERAEKKAENAMYRARLAEKEAVVVAKAPRKRARRVIEVGPPAALDARGVAAGLKALRGEVASARAAA